MKTNYFHKIDNEHKAYWLGFLYADGCVDKNMYSVIVDISIKDISLLEKFCNDIEYQKNIKIHGNNNQYCKIVIASKEMCHDLYEHGCTPAKSLTLKFPSEDILPQNLRNHFIRGYYDGDGCLSFCHTFRKRKDIDPSGTKLYEWKTWFFKLLGTEDMMTHIQNILPDYISVTSEGKIKRLKCGGSYKIYNILKYLYCDATIFMNRKYEKYLELQNYVLSKI